MPHVHVDEPVAALEVPVGQVVHDEDPADIAYVLIAQAWHGPKPLVPYCPVVHEHDDTIPPGLSEPAGQLVQELSVGLAAYLPVAQFSKHADKEAAPARLVLPLGHVVQAVAPANEYVPAEHWVTDEVVQREPAGHCVHVAVAPCNSW
jgi:hypothetical protein